MDKQKKVKRIFDSISPSYDFLNHFLSIGIDYYWRNKALKLSKINNETILLDVACGTGDFSIAAKKMGVIKIYGTDLSGNMLSLFKKKANWIDGYLVQAVAEQMPLKNNSFTNITVAFGVRNFYDIKEGFTSFYNVLKENGKVTILEFRLPKNFIVRGFYLFYFNKILPFIGRIVSKDKEAYTYLPKSVDEFDRKVDLVRYLKETGFRNVVKHSLTFGIVQIVIAEK